MKKRLFQLGYYLTVVITVVLYSQYLYHVGKYGQWLFDASLFLIAYMMVSVLLTRKHYLEDKFDKQTATNLSLLFGIPMVFFVFIWLQTGSLLAEYTFLYIVGLGILNINYLIAGLLK
ncbi:hypothetical protein [Paracholeplasma manati]|uniref:hypothetical protein n=1 Tax=Paracholeplasma manati TaxID=591373 RepID=UPI002407DA7A|nr:hypothetical protein [Paracholeplasma manati]MDG0889546.1 hypothetical protein [Paracholeplasma manati]